MEGPLDHTKAKPAPMSANMQSFLTILAELRGQPNQFKAALEWLVASLIANPTALLRLMESQAAVGNIDLGRAKILLAEYLEGANENVVAAPSEPTIGEDGEIVPTVVVSPRFVAPAENPPARVARMRASSGSVEHTGVQITSLIVDGVSAPATWKRAYLDLVERAVRTGHRQDLPDSWLKTSPTDNGKKHESQLPCGLWLYHNLSMADQERRTRKVAHVLGVSIQATTEAGETITIA